MRAMLRQSKSSFETASFEADSLINLSAVGQVDRQEFDCHLAKSIRRTRSPVSRAQATAALSSVAGKVTIFRTNRLTSDLTIYKLQSEKHRLILSLNALCRAPKSEFNQQISPDNLQQYRSALKQGRSCNTEAVSVSLKSRPGFPVGFGGETFLFRFKTGFQKMKI